MRCNKMGVRTLARGFLTGLLLVAGLATVVSATNDEEAYDGIYVGQPKVYDEAVLRRMLAETEARLAALRGVDAAKVSAAIGTVQGSSSHERSFGMQVQGLPTPEVITKESSAGTEVQTKEPSVTPGIPAAPAFGTSHVTSLGIGASDILQEQVSLEYQVMNLRMLLQGSLSDDFDFEDEAKVEAAFRKMREAPTRGQSAQEALEQFNQEAGRWRQRTVVGFDISIEPDEVREDQVAEVIVRVSENVPKPPRVMALIPQKDAYNVARITKQSTNLGLGAVVNVFSLGIAAGSKRETYYLVKDVDTVALDHGCVQYEPGAQTTNACRRDALEAKELRGIEIGWQFRPVLGQRVVSPGVRHVYVMLSTSSRGPGDMTSFSVEVYRKWRKWDRKDGQVEDDDSVHLTPVDFDVEVPSGEMLAYAAHADIDLVGPIALEGGRALYSATCGNCDETDVLFGGRFLTRETGLLSRERHRLVFAVNPADAPGSTPVLLPRRFAPPLVLDGFGERPDGWSVSRASFAAKSDKGATVVIEGQGLEESQQPRVDVIAGSAEFSEDADFLHVSDGMLVIQLDKDVAASLKKLVVTDGRQDQVVALATPAPAVTAAGAAPWKINTVGDLVVRGAALGRVTRVTCDGRHLKHSCSTGGDVMVVVLDKDTTSALGTKILVLDVDDGSTVNVTLPIGA